MLVSIVTTLMWVVLAISVIALALSVLVWLTPSTKKQKEKR